ncbi:MAG TPA: MEDS domain-containing protein, partial [Dehalococcoidia bacterium]|nr:MEDS domain-containing protein [Dehalococcoidia bacterium]
MTVELTRAGDAAVEQHLCLFYNNPKEQLPVLVPFLAEGLRNGERCIYVTDDLTVDEMRLALEAHGIDVRQELELGSLCLWTRREWRQPGELDSAKKAAQVREIIDSALKSGFKGVRFGVEMTWTLGPDIEVERLRHWEATINTIFTPDVPARIYCQYSRSRLSPDALLAGLNTHPVAVLEGEICANPYYEAPLLLNDARASVNGTLSSARVEWMTSQLLLARAAQKEREERIRAEAALKEAEAARERIEEFYNLAQKTVMELERANKAKNEFLALVSHELRTPITTILGNAEILRSQGRSMDEVTREQALADMHADAKRLSDIIVNLLLLARLESGQVVPVEPVLLERLVKKVVEGYQTTQGHRIHLRFESDATIALANPAYVEDILRNLLSNAEKYSSPQEPIEVQVSREPSQAVVSVLDRGIGLRPED